MSSKKSFRLACPISLQNEDHYKEAHSSNCTTQPGFANRQLLRQHIISEHLALCPNCFELKKADCKDKKVPDKKIETVMAWRRAHVKKCRPEGGPQNPPPGRMHLTDVQAEEFAALDHKTLVSGITDQKDYEFAWWKKVFNALYPRVLLIPEPDTRFFLPRSEIRKEAQKEIQKEFQNEVQKQVVQQVLKIAETLVHATQSGQVGLPLGKTPDPHRYLQLDPRLIECLSPQLDMLRLPKVDGVPRHQPNSDSGYSSTHGDTSSSPTGPGSPSWGDPMMLDGDTPSGGDFSHLGIGAGALNGLEDDFIGDLTRESRQYRQRRPS